MLRDNLAAYAIGIIMVPIVIIAVVLFYINKGTMHPERMIGCYGVDSVKVLSVQANSIIFITNGVKSVPAKLTVTNSGDTIIPEHGIAIETNGGRHVVVFDDKFKYIFVKKQGQSSIMIIGSRPDATVTLTKMPC